VIDISDVVGFAQSEASFGKRVRIFYGWVGVRCEQVIRVAYDSSDGLIEAVIGDKSESRTNSLFAYAADFKVNTGRSAQITEALANFIRRRSC
jgi:hypothetical protein